MREKTSGLYNSEIQKCDIYSCYTQAKKCENSATKLIYYLTTNLTRGHFLAPFDYLVPKQAQNMPEWLQILGNNFDNSEPIQSERYADDITQDRYSITVWIMWRWLNLLQIIYCLGVAIVGAIAFRDFWAISCYKIFGVWLLGQIAISILQILSSLVMLAALPLSSDNCVEAMHRAKRAFKPYLSTRFILICFVLWQIFGIVCFYRYILQNNTSECNSKRSHPDPIFTLSAWLIMIHSSVLILSSILVNIVPTFFSLLRAVEIGEMSLSSLNQVSPACDPKSLHETHVQEGASDSDCTICQTNISNGDRVSKLYKCGHEFHAACINISLGYSLCW